MTQALSAQEWQTDLERAKSIASEKQYKIVLVFQGSDWCAPSLPLRCLLIDDRFRGVTTEFYVFMISKIS